MVLYPVPLTVAAAMVTVVVWKYAERILSGLAFGFRDDTFWAWSSGFTRRGLSGEVIYRLDLLTGAGPFLFSVLLVAVFAVIAVMALDEMYRRLTAMQFALLCLTPVVLIYRVDAEILILLPFLGLILARGAGRGPVTLALIAVATLTRELALVLFLPVLLTLATAGPVWLRVTTVVTVAALALPFVLGSQPTYALETLYWPEHGVPGLRDMIMYRFAEMGLAEVLGLHLGFWAEDGLIVLPSILVFLALALSVLVPAGPQGPRAALVFLPLVAAMFILTVDYGRYFYFLVFYLALATRPDCLPFFDLRDWRGLPGPEAVMARAGHWAARHRTAVLVAFALVPSGFWTNEYQALPRVILFLRTMVEEAQRMF
jgi:hypothetical protein